jgi:hypothetical protein
LRASLLRFNAAAPQPHRIRGRTSRPHALFRMDQIVHRGRSLNGGDSLTARIEREATSITPRAALHLPPSHHVAQHGAMHTIVAKAHRSSRICDRPSGRDLCTHALCPCTHPHLRGTPSPITTQLRTKTYRGAYGTQYIVHLAALSKSGRRRLVACLWRRVDHQGVAGLTALHLVLVMIAQVCPGRPVALVSAFPCPHLLLIDYSRSK